MKWILIVWIAGYYQGGLTTAEFETRAACEAANADVVPAIRATVNVAIGAICVRKGEAPYRP